jgi:hypothetical protein
MNDKSTVLKAFNNHFFEFIQDIINIFPENEDLKSTKTGLEFFKKANPTCIAKAWEYFVHEQYKDVIEKGDITFFFEKDYNNDLTYMSNAREIMKAIDKIREPVRNMGDENKAHTMKYIQNLCKLSGVYKALSQ